MSNHIIFDINGKFKGYSDNPKWLKLFLNQRKDKYNVCKLHKNKLHPELRNEILEDWNKITALKISGETLIVTCAEGVEFLKFIDEETEILKYNIDTVLNILPVIKLTDKERVIIEECLSIIDIGIDNYNELGDDSDILDKFKLFKKFIE